MNTGIQDACALADALAASLHGDDGALDRYSQRRREVARRVATLADRMTVLAAARRGRSLRNHVLAALGQVPAVPRALAFRLSGLAYR